MDLPSDDDVVTEFPHSSELPAPPDVVEGGAAQEHVGPPLALQPVEVGDVRVTDREYVIGAGATLRHWLGGEYPRLGDGHDDVVMTV